jgi:hypothetical protein
MLSRSHEVAGSVGLVLLAAWVAGSVSSVFLTVFRCSDVLPLLVLVLAGDSGLTNTQEGPDVMVIEMVQSCPPTCTHSVVYGIVD